MKFCNMCGNKVKIEYQFCDKCGFNFNNENVEIKEEIITPTEPIVDIPKIENINIENKQQVITKKPVNMNLAAVLEMFLGSFGVAQFYMKNNFKAYLQLAITLSAIISIMIYNSSDLYELTAPTQTNAPMGVYTTMTLSYVNGLFIYGMATLAIHAVLCFFHGLSLFSLRVPHKVVNINTFIIPIAAIVFFMYCHTHTVECKNILNNGYTVEYKVNNYYFEIEPIIGLTTLTFEVIPDYDCYDIALEIDVLKTNGQLLQSYNITETKMLKGKTYQYTYKLSTSELLSISKYTYRFSGTRSETYYAVKLEK